MSSGRSVPLDVRDSYDAAAAGYAEHLFSELDQKPLDRHLLDRFAEAVAGPQPVADLGCGPAHISKYLRARGVSVFGLDLSLTMGAVARSLSPDVRFLTGDMLRLPLRDASLHGIVAFYSIVHFAADELAAAFGEMRRVLSSEGFAFIAFHLGEEVVHVDDLFGSVVSLDFRFHRAADVRDALHRSGFAVIEQVEREPYPGVEYASRRCYLLATAT